MTYKSQISSTSMMSSPLLNIAVVRVYTKITKNTLLIFMDSIIHIHTYIVILTPFTSMNSILYIPIWVKIVMDDLEIYIHIYSLIVLWKWACPFWRFKNLMIYLAFYTSFRDIWLQYNYVKFTTKSGVMEGFNW